jgi:hypothetical protein
MKSDEGRDESREGSSSGQMQQPSSQKVSEQKEPWENPQVTNVGRNLADRAGGEPPRRVHALHFNPSGGVLYITVYFIIHP